MGKESEFRAYPYIVDRLKDMGWDTRSPKQGGNVYTQNEASSQNAKLKQALGADRPEYVVVVQENDFWVIEAKADEKDLSKAMEQAKGRAKQINAISGIKCELITGFAGGPDTTHYIETHCLVGGKWQRLKINDRHSTGFISPEQAREILDNRTGKLRDYEIPDSLFKKKSKEINTILHNGAINKRNRAGVLACLLLALANDPKMLLSDKPRTLINDINTRAKSGLEKYDKQQFYEEIKIKPPASPDNHIKNREALTRSIEILRDLNIASAIGSGRDILGHCYEEFLKYANDAKEIGIVLTPRHITNFGAEIIDIQKKDIVFDPTCGTGGFLVAALDKVRRDGANIDDFKRGNLYGVEQDAFVATLAIVNMVFRGDGSSNIKEGNCFKSDIDKEADKVLMNPPFALTDEKEWQFVDKALEKTREGGLLFAVLPANTMNSSEDSRGEVSWRKHLLKRHKLIAVIKLAEGLFYPQVSKGTYGVVIKAHCKHDFDKDKVVWAVLEDGIQRTKTSRPLKSNMKEIATALKNYIATQTEPDLIPKILACSAITDDNISDLSPENHIKMVPVFDIESVLQSREGGSLFLKHHKRKKVIAQPSSCSDFELAEFFEIEKMEKGRSGTVKHIGKGDMPLVTATKYNNGIGDMVNEEDCKKIYSPGQITISDFGQAHYHDYKFAAICHAIVCTLRPKYRNKTFALFLCASINSESARYSWYRAASLRKIQQMKIRIPVNEKGEIDDKQIKQMVNAQ